PAAGGQRRGRAPQRPVGRLHLLRTDAGRAQPGHAGHRLAAAGNAATGTGLSVPGLLDRRIGENALQGRLRTARNLRRQYLEASERQVTAAGTLLESRLYQSSPSFNTGMN